MRRLLSQHYFIPGVLVVERDLLRLPQCSLRPRLALRLNQCAWSAVFLVILEAFHRKLHPFLRPPARASGRWHLERALVAYRSAALRRLRGLLAENHLMPVQERRRTVENRDSMARRRRLDDAPSVGIVPALDLGAGWLLRFS